MMVIVVVISPCASGDLFLHVGRFFPARKWHEMIVRRWVQEDNKRLRDQLEVLVAASKRAAENKHILLEE